jgi:hypothetical protein
LRSPRGRKGGREEKEKGKKGEKKREVGYSVHV